ncbi:MAG: hypothetical protein ABI663_14890 [Chryseolinea sp.]
MKRIILGFIILSLMTLVMQACLHKIKVEKNSSSVSDTLHYVVDIPTNSRVKQIAIQALVSQQQISVVINIFNDTGNPMIIQPQAWELQTQEGSRSLPVSIQSFQKEVANGQSARIEILYEPTHSRKLFQMTELRGDIDPSYILEVKTQSAGIEKSESIHARIEEELYLQSVRKFGLIATTLPYTISASDDFVQKQKSYLANANFPDGKRKEHSVNVSENEILIDGLWLKLQTYLRSDSLYASIRIVNQSAVTVLVDPSSITLINGREKIKPLYPHSAQPFKILNGGRAQLQLRFPVSGTGPFSLDLQSIIFDIKNPLPVFCNNTSLQQVEIPTGYF